MFSDFSSLDCGPDIDVLYEPCVTTIQTTASRFFNCFAVTPFIANAIVRPGSQVRPETTLIFKPLNPL
jgi:hypothetical protein